MKSIVAFLIVAYLFTFAKVGAQTNNAYFQPGKYRSEMRDTAVMCLNKAEEILDNSPQEAYDLANKARSIAISLNEKEAEATANRIAGIANVSLDKAKEAELLLTDALTFYRKNNNEKYIADIYYYLGKAYFSMAEYESSVEFYQHAIKVYQKLNSIQDIAYAFQNLGLIHQNLDNFEKAVDYYNRAMDINLELDNQEQIAALLQNIGTIESMKNNPGKARDLYLQSLEIFHTINDTQGIATTYSNIGLLKLKNQELKEANAFFDTAYAYFSQINLRLGQVWTLFNLGVCEYYKENYDKAEQYYFQSLNLSKEIDNKEGKLSNYEALSNLYQKTKKFEVALDYYKDYIAVGDSIHSTETQQKIAEFEAMNNYEASQRLLAKVDNELKRKKTQNKALYGVFSVVLLASVVVFFAYRQKLQAERKLAEHKADLEKIIEQRTSELENQITNRRIAEESDKLKSAFLANMSHELRTPMNAIIAFSNFLRDPNLSQTLTNDYINHITSAGNSLLCLVDDIIDIAKIESGQLRIFIKATDITRMMQDLYKFYSEYKTKKEKQDIQLNLNIDKDHHYIINTDENRVKQILSNLIDNAFKYTCSGSVDFGFKMKDKSIVFFVKDTGAGIPGQKLPHIFKRFYQIQNSSDQRSGGTGLGLAICKNLVELLGGKIHVESEFGKGSCFQFEIPIDSVKKQYIPTPVENNFKPIETNLELDNKTILIAEDEELNFKVLDSFLSRTNATLLRAEDGAKAIDIFKSEKIDLVLMDIQMPIMDGYEATKEIKRMNNRIPVIVQTSFAMEGEKEKCLEAGCDDFITKPLDLNLLIEKIRNYL